MSKIEHFLLVIYYSIYGAGFFQFTQFPSWWLREYIALSYYHHQIGSMNYYPLFRVRSWNNGMHCMSLYILILRDKAILWLSYSTKGFLGRWHINTQALVIVSYKMEWFRWSWIIILCAKSFVHVTQFMEQQKHGVHHFIINIGIQGITQNWAHTDMVY